MNHNDRLRNREPLDICNVLAQWAEAAEVSSPRAGIGRLAIAKSDLLNRLIYGGERGPSQTPCPVHEGHWSGCHFGWPGAENVGFMPSGFGAIIGSPPREVEPMLQEWWDAGCRCATHKGSTCTTGWNPDEHCGCAT